MIHNLVLLLSLHQDKESNKEKSRILEARATSEHENAKVANAVENQRSC